MPITQNQGVNIYWQEQGQGVPILLIMGLGWASDLWHRTRPILSSHYRTIVLDNRGVGRSDVPPGPYPIAVMASDAAAVLDAAGIESAHVFGVSMGGMIAQEFALQYPQRVKTLILGCTAAGGPQAVSAGPEVVEALLHRSSNPDEFAETTNRFIYDSSTPRDRIEADMLLRKKWYPTELGYTSQLQGIAAWEAYSRLDQITAPTLVIHGETDRLVPPANGRLIAQRIPGAKLAMIPHASHVFFTDQPDASQREILGFLSAHSKRSRRTSTNSDARPSSQ
ncbi:MAG TPA: alpha/beta fold hydrolase [Candidatus Acidoferrales bacterium]|nr:alpha/beta fold hydrolase [Candidatus Acidoferrales bacterium]